MSYCKFRGYLAMFIIILFILSLSSSLSSVISDTKKETDEKAKNISILSSVIIFLFVIFLSVNYAKDSEFNCCVMVTNELITKIK